MDESIVDFMQPLTDLLAGNYTVKFIYRSIWRAIIFPFISQMEI